MLRLSQNPLLSRAMTSALNASGPRPPMPDGYSPYSNGNPYSGGNPYRGGTATAAAPVYQSPLPPPPAAPRSHHQATKHERVKFHKTRKHRDRDRDHSRHRRAPKPPTPPSSEESEDEEESSESEFSPYTSSESESESSSPTPPPRRRSPKPKRKKKDLKRHRPPPPEDSDPSDSESSAPLATTAPTTLPANRPPQAAPAAPQPPSEQRMKFHNTLDHLKSKARHPERLEALQRLAPDSELMKLSPDVLDIVGTGAYHASPAAKQKLEALAKTIVDSGTRFNVSDVGKDSFLGKTLGKLRRQQYAEQRKAGTFPLTPSKTQAAPALQTVRAPNAPASSDSDESDF